MGQQIETVGKKIFLLYPHSVIREDMLDLLIMAGYETYTLVDEKKAMKLLAMFPGSIMFINIDEGLKENEWEIYVRAVQENPKTRDSRLGIMSYNQDPVLMKKYLMKLEVPCGYVQLKLGVQESTKIILSALEANEARGRRSSIRASCEDDKNATVNFKDNSQFLHGKILDISSAGIAARFDKLPSYPINAILRSVQLKLHGVIVMTDMIFVAQRPNDRLSQVLLYGPKLSTNSKLVIHHYIKQCLEKYINELKI